MHRRGIGRDDAQAQLSNTMSETGRENPPATVVARSGPVPWNQVALALAVLDLVWLVGFTVAAVVWAPVILAFNVVWLAFGAFFLRAWRRRAPAVEVEDGHVRLSQPGSFLVRSSDQAVALADLSNYRLERRAFGTCLVLAKRSGGVIRVPLRVGADLAVLAAAGLPSAGWD